MRNNILCPECENYFSSEINRCKCGWRSPMQNNTKTSNFRCQYSNSERPCRLPGSICSHPYSTQGPWYCAEHWKALGDSKACDSASRYIEENYKTIMEELISWRDKLFYKTTTKGED